jgi:hypothetical protein
MYWKTKILPALFAAPAAAGLTCPRWPPITYGADTYRRPVQRYGGRCRTGSAAASSLIVRATGCE